MIEDTRLFSVIEPYVAPEDFTEPLYREVAQMLYGQFHSGTVNPAEIISRFTDEEQQKEIAALFHARIYPIEEKAEREKALAETILRVKQNSLDYRSEHLEPTDLAGLQQIINDRKKLDGMRNLHISLD